MCATKETSRLLDAWRHAERAAAAAHNAADHAKEAAEAACKAAEAATLAAEDAGVSVNAADSVATGANGASHNHEAELAADEAKKRPKGLPGGLRETT